MNQISDAAKFVWRPRASTFIDPARLQILSDHQPSFEEIVRVVRNNPFVPPDHEEIFLRGLHAGFHGDLTQTLKMLKLAPEIRAFLANLKLPAEVRHFSARRLGVLLDGAGAGSEWTLIRGNFRPRSPADHQKNVGARRASSNQQVAMATNDDSDSGAHWRVKGQGAVHGLCGR